MFPFTFNNALRFLPAATGTQTRKTPSVEKLLMLALFIGFMFSSVLLGLAFLSLAVLLSVIARDRTRASGLAIAAWFFFVLVFDLLMLGLLVGTGGRVGGDAFTWLLLLNPADVFRILNVFSLEDVRTLYGLASIVPPALGNPLAMGAVMLVWIALPLMIAKWRFKP